MQQRREDKEGPVEKVRVTVHRWLSTIIAAAIVASGLWAAPMYFATAADVNKKYSELRAEMKLESALLQKRIMEIELFKLRSSGKTDPVTQAQINQFESELVNLNAKIRQLEERR